MAIHLKLSAVPAVPPPMSHWHTLADFILEECPLNGLLQITKCALAEEGGCLSKNRFGPRQLQIVRALYENGPLSLRALQQLIDPPIALRRLQDAAKRLHEGGLVVRRHTGLPPNTGHFIQLCARNDRRELLADLLNVDRDALQVPHFRGQELCHSEACAIWVCRFRQLFPDARFIREHEYSRCSIASRILLSSGADHELRPDFLMRFPRADGKSFVNVGVEVERSRKTDDRLERKLKILATQTLLDGVIYLCDGANITEALRNIYNSRVVSKALRIGHYGANFLLISDGSMTTHGQEPRMVNAKLETVSLAAWIHFLLNSEQRQRRDHQLI